MNPPVPPTVVERVRDATIVENMECMVRDTTSHGPHSPVRLPFRDGTVEIPTINRYDGAN